MTHPDVHSPQKHFEEERWILCSHIKRILFFFLSLQFSKICGFCYVSESKIAGNTRSVTQNGTWKILSEKKDYFCLFLLISLPAK